MGSAFFGSIREAVQSHSSQNVISNMQTMNEVIADSLAQRRFSMMILGSFAAAALLLASLGIYGVISYLVGQRMHELGIRLALGAKRTDVLRLVLGHGMKMAIAGIAIGGFRQNLFCASRVALALQERDVSEDDIGIGVG